MSNTVICRECSTPNQVGSKFCNNCGARLPLSTNILCPTCQTPNPRNRLYCDNCGTRLVPDESSKPKLKKPEPKAEEPTTPKGFSLPARKPGDTGELDPNSVPDWLKTGTTSSSIPETDFPSTPKDSGKLPRLDDLTPPKKTTADLPDWLVDSDSNTLFKQAPREITTEHYLDLLKRKDEEDSGFFIDDDTTISGSGANLPDWLSSLDTPKPPAANIPAISAGQMSEGAPDWLKELNQPPTPPKSEPPQQPAAKTTPKEEDLTDWLLELGPPNTDILSAPKSGSLVEDERADWMAELGPPNTDILSSPAAQKGDSFSQEETADWLDDLGEPDSKLWTIPEQPQGTAENEKGDEFDWLNEETSTPQPQTADTSTGWSNDFDWLQEETPTTATPTTDKDQSWESDFDWLSEEPESSSQSLAEVTSGSSEEWDDSPDWLSEEPAETSPTSSAPTTAPEEFGWDDDLEWVADEAQTPDPTGSKSSGFDWLIQPSSATQSSETAESFEPEIEPSEPLPSWLMNLGDTSDKASTGELPEFDDTFLGDLPSETSSLNWLMQTGDLPQQPDVLSLSDSATAETGEDTLTLGEEPDWLSEFDTTPEPSLKTAEPALPPIQTPPSIPDKLKSDAEAAFLFANLEPEEPPIIDEPIIEPAIEEGLPDWLQELGPRADTFSTPPPVEQSNLIPSDEMPEWVASMKPGSGFGESVLPNVMSSPSLAPESLDEIPLEFAGAELPDWLGEIPQATATPQTTNLPTTETLPDIPDWLQTDESATKSDQRETAESASGTASSELSSLLRDLPPPQPQQPLVKADIPEWVQALKPKELTGEAGVSPTTGQLESSGPLMGLRGVVNIEPIIAMPRSGRTTSTFTITQEQEQQASLLRQLAREVTQSPTLVKPQIKDTALVWERIIIALLILSAIITGLLGPTLFTPTSTPSPTLTGVHSAITAASGRPVLVAFEYSPSMAAELTPQAKMLLEELQSNNSPIITVSQSAMGAAIAQEITTDYAALAMPLVPGEAAGLRQLIACFSPAAGCPIFLGQSLDAHLVSQLQQVGLVVVLTSEQTSLQDWIEQVQVNSNVPVVAGLPQSLGPLAAPYIVSEQLQGVIEGLPETAVYRAVYLSPNDTVLDQFNAQQLTQLVIIVLLLIGGLYYGAKTSMTKSQKRRSRA